MDSLDSFGTCFLGIQPPCTAPQSLIIHFLKGKLLETKFLGGDCSWSSENAGGFDPVPRGDWECDSRLVIFWKTFRTKWPRVYSTLYGTEFGSTNFKKKHAVWSKFCQELYPKIPKELMFPCRWVNFMEVHGRPHEMSMVVWYINGIFGPTLAGEFVDSQITYPDLQFFQFSPEGHTCLSANPVHGDDTSREVVDCRIL